MSENPDYSLVRQYLILSDAHQRALNNYYETTLNFHRNTTDVILQYMENRWFQDTRIERIVSRNRLHTATIRALDTTSRDISLNTSSSREISGDDQNPSINGPYHPFNRRRRVFYHSRPPPPQTMARNTILSPLNTQRRPRNNTNSRDEIDNTPASSPPPPPLPRSPGGTLIRPPIRIPPPPPTEPIIIPQPPSANNEMTRLIDSPTSAQSNDTTDTITPNTRNRSNSMMERGMRRRSPNRLRSRRSTVPFYLPNLVPTTTETDLINTPYDSPVRIRPSIRQIRNATEVILYSQLSQDTRDTQSRCPIDIVEFLPEDTVLRIRHCGHIFREMNLRQHFRRHPRCPLCRFDIRDYVASTYNLPSSSTTPTSIRNARAVLARVNETLETNLNSIQNDPSANTITSLTLSRRRTERTNTHEE